MASRGRRAAFTAIMALIVVAGAEALAQLSYAAIYGNLYDPEDLLGVAEPGAIHMVPPGEPGQGQGPHQVIHPYFGFAWERPGARRTLGFLEDYSPLEPRAPGEFRVILTGGSVAYGQSAPDAVEAALQAAFDRRGIARAVRLFNAAMGGFKQPQQLLAVDYLLYLGAPMDLVVNLDGFNEIVLAWHDNARRGVDPHHPRRWDERIHALAGSVDLRVMGAIVQTRAVRRAVAAWYAEGLVPRSALAGLYGRWRLGALDREIVAMQGRVVADPASADAIRGRVLYSGGALRARDRDAVFAEAASAWARGSRLLARSLDAQGIPYVHVLQPNQYLAGSKPLTDEERATAHDLSAGYGPIAAAGYPYLLEAAGTLADGGYFFDATRLFAEVEETVYRDPCCHLNALGKRMLADYIAGAAMSRLGGDGSEPE